MTYQDKSLEFEQNVHTRLAKLEMAFEHLAEHLRHISVPWEQEKIDKIMQALKE